MADLEARAADNPEATDTALLIRPQALADFLDFSDFRRVAEGALEGLAHEGGLQIANIHPATHGERLQMAGSVRSRTAAS